MIQRLTHCAEPRSVRYRASSPLCTVGSSRYQIQAMASDAFIWWALARIVHFGGLNSGLGISSWLLAAGLVVLRRQEN